jgi:hypothetical protein
VLKIERRLAQLEGFEKQTGELKEAKAEEVRSLQSTSQANISTNESAKRAQQKETELSEM